MTAPAVTENAPADPSSPFAVDDAIASITSAAVAQTMAESPETEEPARDVKGRFTPKADVDGTQPTTTETAPEPITEAPPVLPQGMVAVPKADRQLATAFKVLDKDGELEVPDVLVEFTANGKTRKEPLDKVVRLAERGFYNEEREQQILSERQNSQQILSQAQQLQARVTQLEQEKQHMLSSDDAYLTERAKWDAANTPEARYQAELARNNQMQQQQLYGQAEQQSGQFFGGEVLPAVELMTKHLPDVSADEIGARLVLLTNHLRIPLPGGGSLIPPAAHDQVRNIVLREITPWAQQLNDHRSGEKSDRMKAVEVERAAAKKKEQALQVEAQKSKSLVGKAGKPANRGDGKETKAPKPITNIDEAQDAALDATFAAMGLERPRGS